VKAPLALIACGGLDPSGHAGLAADLRAGAALGVLVAPVAAALTVQGGGRLHVQPVEAGLLSEQLAGALDGARPAALKLGLLAGAAQVQAVASFIRAQPQLPVVLDPVLNASHGGSMVQADLLPALRRELVPLCSLLTPNLPETEDLLGHVLAPTRGGVEAAARELLGLGAPAVLIKGGHAESPDSPDLFADAGGLTWLEGHRVESPNTRGTGCSLATAIAVHLAQGLDAAEACRQAKAFLTQLLQQNQGLHWPQGPGPVLPA
jgi:hydroxymethylpyrimidine/phosphomethylpyrimidine kinase